MLKNIIRKLLILVIHPILTKEKIRWRLQKRLLKTCGKNTFMAEFFALREPQNISMGNNTRCGDHCQLYTYEYYMNKPTGYKPELIIGNNVMITSYCSISCMNGITIGDGCLLGINTFITDNFHGDISYKNLMIPPDERTLFSKGKVTLGKNIWVGRNVCIMPGVSIGDGAVIGANAVVSRDIPSYCVAAGVPAKIIKRNNKNNENNA